MARRTKIELGTPVEELPEWSVSLDYVEEKKEEEVKHKEEIQKQPVQQNIATSALDSGFVAEFVLDGEITSQTMETQGDMDNGIEASNSALDYLHVNAYEDSQENHSLISENEIEENTISVEAGDLAGSFLETPEDKITAEEEQVIEPVEGEPVIEPVEEEPAIEPVEEEEPVIEPVEEEEPVIEPVEEEEPVIEPVEEELRSEEIVDEVEEKLCDLVNSMQDWEQSENALSEAAAMLSGEEKEANRVQGEKEEQDEDEKLRNLLERLDISDEWDRMNATVRQDREDISEQREKEIELPVEEEPVIEPVEEEEPVIEPAATEEPEIEDLPQKEQSQAESSGVLADFEISNDMFDMGMGDMEEQDYSDENIDLSAFRGSIKDAEEINANLDNQINLDEQNENKNDMAGFDMSNLVAAALNDLSKRSVPEEETDMKPETYGEEETDVTPETYGKEDTEPDEVLESELQIESLNREEEEEGGSNISLDMLNLAQNVNLFEEDKKESEESGRLDLLTGNDSRGESEVPTVSGLFADVETETVPEVEMISEEETVSEVEMVSEEETVSEVEMVSEEETVPEVEMVSEEETVSEVETITEEETVSEMEYETDTADAPDFVSHESAEIAAEESVKLVFEPAFPGAENMVDIGDYAFGQGDSLIIEDYVEAPNASEAEEKTKKQDKEKKRFLGRKTRHQTSELSDMQDDLEKPGVTNSEQGAKPEFVLNDSVKRQLEKENKKREQDSAVQTASEKKEPETVTTVDPENALVVGRQVIHKDGKHKRTYFRLIYQ